MGYIFISFKENLESRPKRHEFYNLSLNEQFDNLQNRLPENKKSNSLKDFINECFPSGMAKNYYFSCPNYSREKNQGATGVNFLNNVVIRPEITESMRKYLPENQNIILIGDIFEGDNLKMLQVKGMEFIDESIYSDSDMSTYDPVCTRFDKFWSIKNVDVSETFFTPNKISDLIEYSFIINNPEKIFEINENWQEYINFRKYYLEEQSKRSFELASVEFISAYSINKKTYWKNQDFYDNYILENNKKEFINKEMVILSEKTNQKDDFFPLIKLNIDRNEKEFRSFEIKKRDKTINEEEIKIRSLSKDNVFITKENVKDNNFKEAFKTGYALGERFKIIKQKILPENLLIALNNKYKGIINQKKNDIDQKFQKIINDELKELVNDYEKRLQENLNLIAEQKRQELEKSLKLDVIKNEDEQIKIKISKIKDDNKKKILKISKKSKNEKNEDFIKRTHQLIEKENNKIDVETLYKERNEELIKNIKNTETKIHQNNKITFQESKLIELKNKYETQINNEKNQIENELLNKLKDEKTLIIENETIIRFSLYFIPTEIDIDENQIKKIENCKFFVYDKRAEEAKIKRQELALKNFFTGYVKNPYLSKYLFNPESLSSIHENYSDWVFYNDKLNEKQKEAVKKAVSSNGLFLLQGPPGTGKTEVITEIVSQLVKIGKKVLVSSETHKAIDNVFERLPKIANIVPIRLIPSNNNKNSNNNYDPLFLVDNFYKNISANMEKAVNRYKNFTETKEKFKKDYEYLLNIYNKILKSKKKEEELDKKIEKLGKNIEEKRKERNKIDDEKKSLENTKISFSIARKKIKNFNFNMDEDDIQEILINFLKELDILFNNEKKYLNDKTDLETKLKNIYNISEEEISKELLTFDKDFQIINLKIEKEKEINKLNRYQNAAGDIIDPKDKEVVEKIKDNLREIIKKENTYSNNDVLKESKLISIFNFNFLEKSRSNIKEKINFLKNEIQSIQNKFLNLLKESNEKIEENIRNVDEKINKINFEIQKIGIQINELSDEEEIKSIKKNKNILENKINDFFKNFDIIKPKQNIEDALSLIEKKWDELEKEFESKQEENKIKIPMYEKISNYLKKEEIIKQDRKKYTKELFVNANVFGLTCTSKDTFDKNNNSAFERHNIDAFDIKSVGIDVVIIDEVSKSSFIDLLIPILYGKTVILVGDHRQLPPMYEFSKLRDEDFESLDPEKIDKNKNLKLTNLYEQSFFKTLFEKIPEDYKIMLERQYRSHEHIMNVFNHFYQGQLKLGYPTQNDDKKHNIEIFSNSVKIIQPDKHVYFINCKENETRDEDSTSISNNGEAEVVVEIIKKLNSYFKENKELKKLSIGVICTYGDQARKIKEKIKGQKINSDNFSTYDNKEKIIVSTVDDFQGDERDIIILSTVRNPEKPERSNPGFILAYQRINVALSRARRLLIIVGNKKYLEHKGRIDLPDMNDKESIVKDFRVYEEIIETIERYGKILDDSDILEIKGGEYE